MTFDSDSLNYVLFGDWAVSASTSATTPNNASFWITGYQTPASQLPTGTASYVANGSTTTSSTAGIVTGIVAAPSGSSFVNGELAGNASLSVNFGTGAISGTFSSMGVTPKGGSTTGWNGVTVAGTIAGGTSTFAGTTAATGTPGGTFGLSTSATGVIDGAFYGPNGQELGAVWSLHDGTGVNGKAAIGVVSATKQ